MENNELSELIDVTYKHECSARGSVSKKTYEMHPYMNVNADGVGKYSARKKGGNRVQEYFTHQELAELFAVDAFMNLNINLRMRPLVEYDGGAPPALQPSAKNVKTNSPFGLLVTQCQIKIKSDGLSRELCHKLVKMGISLPSSYLPSNIKTTKYDKEDIDNEMIVKLTSPQILKEEVQNVNYL